MCQRARNTANPSRRAQRTLGSLHNGGNTAASASANLITDLEFDRLQLPGVGVIARQRAALGTTLRHQRGCEFRSASVHFKASKRELTFTIMKKRSCIVRQRGRVQPINGGTAIEKCAVSDGC